MSRTASQSETTYPWKPHLPRNWSCSRYWLAHAGSPLIALYAHITEPALPSTIGGAECGLVGVHLVVLAHVHIGKVPGRLRAAVHGIVLGCCDRAVVLRIVALHSGDVGNAHAAGEERIFAVGLLSAAPARITEDVQVRGPEIQASAMMPACPSRASCTCLMRPSIPIWVAMAWMSRRIEGRGQTDRLRILRYTLVDHAVERLTPPLVRRNVEPRNCGGLVLHLRSLFRKGHAMHQVGCPLLGDKLVFIYGRFAVSWATADCINEPRKSVPVHATKPATTRVMRIFMLYLQVKCGDRQAPPRGIPMERRSDFSKDCALFQ